MSLALVLCVFFMAASNAAIAMYSSYCILYCLALVQYIPLTVFLVCLYLAFIVEILFKFIAVKYHKLSSSGVSLSAIIMRPMNTCKKYIMLRGKAKTQKKFFFTVP